MIDAGDIARAIHALLEEQRNLPASLFHDLNSTRWNTIVVDGKVVSAEVRLEHGYAQGFYYKITVEPCTQGEVYRA